MNVKKTNTKKKPARSTKKSATKKNPAAKMLGEKTKKPAKKPAAKKVTAKKPKAPLVPIVPKVDPSRAEAAAEVLQAVWLHEKHFELEQDVVQKDGSPVVDQDDNGHFWVTVRICVPAIDVEMWLDGTHDDHPDNVKDADEDVAPIDDAPIDDAPIDAAPIDAAPIDAAPIDPTPIDPTPIDAPDAHA